MEVVDEIEKKRDLKNSSKINYETFEYSRFLLENEDMPEAIVELNKNKNESIVPFFRSKGVDALSSSLYDNEENIHAKLITIKGKPVFIYKDTTSQINGLNCNGMFNEKIKTIITELPIPEKDIKVLAYACNYLKVLVGTYGSLDDADYPTKLKELYKIKKIFESISTNEIISKRNFKSKDMYMEYITTRTRKK